VTLDGIGTLVKDLKPVYRQHLTASCTSSLRELGLRCFKMVADDIFIDPDYQQQSQNVWGWKGPLWVTQSNPPAEAGSPTAG